MRIVHLPTHWTILLDIAAWFVIHLGVVYIMTVQPSDRFDPQHWLHRPRAWERGGRLYERRLRIRRWKEWLPDGADLVRWRSFRKKRLTDRSVAYYQRFVRETCRAEWTHWIHLAFAPFFFLWNPAWVGVVMIAYAAGENLPLIIAQRYTRGRLQRVLSRGMTCQRWMERHGAVRREPACLVR